MPIILGVIFNACQWFPYWVVSILLFIAYLNVDVILGTDLGLSKRFNKPSLVKARSMIGNASRQWFYTPEISAKCLI